MNIHLGRSLRILLGIALPLITNFAAGANGDITHAKKSLEKSVRFYRENVSIAGGSVFRVSANLKQREGEGKVGPREAWIQPPGTPAVGLAYLRCWQISQEPLLLDAALEVADALIRGQLESGGWGENIEFDPLLRPRYAYRVDNRTVLNKRQNRSTFDDNKSQSCLKFLMLLDRELEFKNAQIHRAALYALNAFRDAQYPNGAWPQKFSEPPDPEKYPTLTARFPSSWNREYQRISYSGFYTLNDNTICDLIELMLTAYAVYQDDQWLASAIRGGEFLLRAQLPEPQPGWAQQYNLNMEPEWARKFEPPAITGGESQQVINMLLTLFDKTGEERFLKPVPRAIEYYESILLASGQLARFYEMKTDKPLFFTKEYELVYTDGDLPTHYGFKVSSRLDRLSERLQQLQKKGASLDHKIALPNVPRMSSHLKERAKEVIRSLDSRGAWVESGTLRTFPEEGQSGQVIETQTYIRNIMILSEYIAAFRQP